jgi:hypothetical protein
VLDTEVSAQEAQAEPYTKTCNRPGITILTHTRDTTKTYVFH